MPFWPEVCGEPIEDVHPHHRLAWVFCYNLPEKLTGGMEHNVYVKRA